MEKLMNSGDPDEKIGQKREISNGTLMNLVEKDNLERNSVDDDSFTTQLSAG